MFQDLRFKGLDIQMRAEGEASAWRQQTEILTTAGFIRSDLNRIYVHMNTPKSAQLSQPQMKDFKGQLSLVTKAVSLRFSLSDYKLTSHN